MNWYHYLIIWFMIGFLAALLLFFFDWLEGCDFCIEDIWTALFLIASGPIAIVALAKQIPLLLNLDGNKILLKGRNKK